jgi:mercuric reductase
VDEFDLAVIGTGGAAMAAGMEARSRGRSAVLVEHGPLGGTCLNIGCVRARTCSPPPTGGPGR